MGLLSVLKRIPVDVGQGTLRGTTKGKLIAMAAVPPTAQGAKALDVGCREGIQTKWLEAHGYDVTAIDKEPIYPRAQTVDIEQGLPFPNAFFDLIWCSEVIEHLHNVPQALHEFRRILKPQGKLVVTTPNSYFWLMQSLRVLGLSPAYLQNPDHKQFFHIADIQRLFPTAQISGFFPYALIKCKITRGVGLLSPTFVIVETAA
ncbi:MAG: class I SAM-dependent methyltransferase [Chloroflexota bacterium]|nr:class I SAM-dependent methyltransferase [Chloroflexota bacterium]PLS78573.1 MAG: hypothetical protein CYG59_17810 [Chloroflexota bacterium]